jgi:type I restriction enzyme S subunit
LYALKFLTPKGNGTSIPQLTVPNLKGNEIYVPSLAEQQKIVARLDNLSEKTQKLEQAYKNKLETIKSLKQSILNTAFNGVS